MPADLIFFMEFLVMVGFKLTGKILKRVCFGFVFCCGASAFALTASAMSINGEWRTVNDDTGQSTSVVRIIQQKDGSYLGTVDYIYPNKDAKLYCDECPQPYTNKHILGMAIIHSLQADDGDSDEYVDGHIMDPKSGKTYHLKITQVSNNELKLRGYIGIPLFGRTQYWHRYQGDKKLLLSSHTG
jgi:uncharacterized protein (DUF2147 family)